MRIKKYDYNTVSKLKNPLRDFDTVYEFVVNNFTQEEKVKLNSEDYIIFFDNDNLLMNVMYESKEDKLHFYTDDLFYEIGRNSIPKQPKDINHNFNKLKNLFLKYKLNIKLKEELSDDLLVNSKKKVSKI